MQPVSALLGTALALAAAQKPLSVPGSTGTALTQNCPVLSEAAFRETALPGTALAPAWPEHALLGAALLEPALVLALLAGALF